MKRVSIIGRSNVNIGPVVVNKDAALQMFLSIDVGKPKFQAEMWIAPNKNFRVTYQKLRCHHNHSIMCHSVQGSHTPWI